MSSGDFVRLAPIHPDSLPDYQTWEAMLRKWNARINLVAPNSLPDFWQRHALDSAQIIPFLPEGAQTIVDFGSGAGFPALAIAIDAKHRQLERTVHLIESVGKKASFLKSVSRETGLPTQIHSDRIETLPSLQADIVTARAFAPLHRLLPMAWHHLKADGALLLLKGEAVMTEIEDAAENWHFEHHLTPSLSQETGYVLEMRNLRPRECFT